MSAPRNVQSSVTVSAPAQDAFDLISDLTLMGQWSSECVRVRWKGKAAGAGSGAKFRGYNRRGLRRWSTSGRITDYQPGRRLAWNVSFLGLPMSTWSYDFEPREGGCLITEKWVDRQLFLTRPPIVGWLVTGTWRRADRNAETMHATLAMIKQAVERTRARA